MSTSAIHEVRTALVEGLSARPALKTVRVSYGPPLPSAPGEFIAIGNAESDEQEANSLGNNRRKEVFRVDVTISVRSSGNDMAAYAARAYELAAEVEQFLRENKRLEATYPTTAPELSWAVFNGVASDELRADGEGREARLYCGVRCSARL